MDLQIIERDGRRYLPTEQLSMTEWPRLTTNQPLPTLPLKVDDLFLITDTLGNISGNLENETKSTTGLFCQDTRFISRLELQIEGQLPIPLSSSAEEGFVLSVMCCNPRSPNLPPKTLGIQRQLALHGGLWEEIVITNYDTQPLSFSVSLSFDADFKDWFEVRGHQRQQRGTLLRSLPPDIDIDLDTLLTLSEFNTNTINLAYQGLDNSLIESQIYFMHRLPDTYKGNTAVWELCLQPGATETLGYRVELVTHKARITTAKPPTTLEQAKTANLLQNQEWYKRVTHISSDNETVNQLISRATRDIFLLRQTINGCTVLSAGVPRFSTLFGRDSLIAASQTLMLDPTMAKGTLEILAQYQGQEDNPLRDEQPGKILHELRVGELARCREIPHTPYYGTVDATPLWLMLYGEYYAWTNDTTTLDLLWPHALAAMDWIDSQSQQNGYLCYQRQSKKGLRNQGWKDSGDSMVTRDGSLATGAIALCEVQAYVYGAKVRLSHLARIKQRIDLAERWENQAKELKQRFNQDFWLDDLDFCALALDGEGKLVDSITSNPGHCLSLGIFTPEKAASVAKRLLEPDMFNGWGIRTLSNQSAAYNPISYHVGSVWPHENSLIALGLRTLNQVDQALEIAKGMIDMTVEQPYYRPPELFSGYQRTPNSSPVKYPGACPLQAWATGSIFQLLQMMVNLEPDAPGNNLHIFKPTLPNFINQLLVRNLRIGSTVLDLQLERADTTTTCKVVKNSGNLTVVIES